jgi:hypothetical protein
MNLIKRLQIALYKEGRDLLQFIVERANYVELYIYNVVLAQYDTDLLKKANIKGLRLFRFAT